MLALIFPKCIQINDRNEPLNEDENYESSNSSSNSTSQKPLILVGPK